MSAGPEARAAMRLRRARTMLGVLALGLLAVSFGNWATVEDAPERAFGEGSPWVLTRQRTLDAWRTALALPAGRLPNALPLVAALAAALAGAFGLLARAWTGGVALAATLLLGAFVVQTRFGDGTVGDAAVLATFLALLVSALCLTETPRTRDR